MIRSPLQRKKLIYAFADAALVVSSDQNKGGLNFILTGSNSQMLSSKFASLLTGRVVELAFFPFFFREYLSYHDSLP